MVSIYINQPNSGYNPYAQAGYGMGGVGAGGGDLYNMSAPAFYGVNLGSLGIMGGYGSLMDNQMSGLMNPMGSGYGMNPYAGGGMATGYGANPYAGAGMATGYGANPYGGMASPYGMPYGNPYGDPYGGYGMNPYGGYGMTDPYGSNPYGTNPYGGDPYAMPNPYGTDPYGPQASPPPETYDPREKRKAFETKGGGHYVRDFADVKIQDDSGNDLYTIDSHQSKYDITSASGKNTYTLFGLANLITIKNFGKDDTLAVTDPSALVVLDEKKTKEGWAMVILDEATGNRIRVNTQDDKHDPDFLLKRVQQA